MNAIIAITKSAARTAFLFLLGPALLWAEPVAPIPDLKPVDPIAEALPILQAKYPDFKELQYKEGDHLSDLVSRSAGKISLDAAETEAAGSSHSVSNVMVTLPDNIFYWRLASFTPEKSWLDTGGQLQQAAPTTAGVVLDLRGTIAPDDYRGAAQVLLFFAPGDMTRFRSSDTTSPDHSNGNPVILAGGQYSFHVPIVVLTNHQTAGAAEALAACLKADGALVMGQSTAGKMGVFEEQKLSSGQILRYFISSVNFQEDPKAVFKIPQHSLVWNQAVMPDISLTVDEQAEKSALDLIQDKRVLDVIAEAAQRHRMSEASLVHGDDPELNDYVEAQEKKPDTASAATPAVRDVVLISALDSLKAIQLSQRAPQAAPTESPTGTSPNAAVSLQ
jgi:C-terminal processing protease CtpA/Prc